MFRRSIVTALIVLTLSPSAASTPQRIARHRSITIASAHVQGHVVTVRVRIVGWKMFPTLIGSQFNRPDGGHWHLFVDRRYIGGTARLTYTIVLSAGIHLIQGELVNNDHSPLRPPVFSRAIGVRIP